MKDLFPVKKTFFDRALELFESRAGQLPPPSNIPVEERLSILEDAVAEIAEIIGGDV